MCIPHFREAVNMAESTKENTNKPGLLAKASKRLSRTKTKVNLVAESMGFGMSTLKWDC